MPSRIALLLLLLLAAGARATPPEYALSLVALEETVPVGARIPLRVELTKRTGKPVEVNRLRLARNSVSLRVTHGEETAVVTRIYGTPERQEDGSYVMADDPPPRAVLRRSRRLVLETGILALRPGPMRVQAVYAGLDAGPGEIVSEPVTIRVEPLPGEEEEAGRTGIGAVMETSSGRMVFALRPDRAYNTVQNFLLLAEDGRYDGLTFHRILPGFVIQGGDPKGTGSGGPGWTIPAELDPDFHHERGVISMSRNPAPDSAGSQFFIVLADHPALDGRYAAFGRLVEGEEVLEELAGARVEVNPKTGEKSKPRDPPVIRSVRLVVR